MGESQRQREEYKEREEKERKGEVCRRRDVDGERRYGEGER